MNKHDRVDWSNLNLVVLPASHTPSEHEAQLREIGHLKGDNDLSEAFFFISDKASPQTIRLYIGDTIASMLRRDCIEHGISYLDSVQVYLLVSLMESHVFEPSQETVAECVMYARTLTRPQVMRAFRHIDIYSDDAKYGLNKDDVRALIQFIQRKL